MIYSKEKHRGCRKKSLPEPNPTKVELPACTNFFTLQATAKELFFKNIEGKMMLGDSQGTVIQVEDPELWNLGTFYQNNHLKPSKHKLYIIMDEEVNCT